MAIKRRRKRKGLKSKSRKRSYGKTRVKKRVSRRR